MESTRRSVIEYQTQIKILKYALQETRENDEMAKNEIETWQVYLDKEGQDHYYTKQTVKGLELKISHLIKDQGP